MSCTKYSYLTTPTFRQCCSLFYTPSVALHIYCNECRFTVVVILHCSVDEASYPEQCMILDLSWSSVVAPDHRLMAPREAPISVGLLGLDRKR